MDHRHTKARESKDTPPALSVVPESLRCHAVDGVSLGSRAIPRHAPAAQEAC
jgi:hypothetical protein